MSKFFRIIVNIFLIFAILLAVVIIVPPFIGIAETQVVSRTMDTNLPFGSITYTKGINVSVLKTGDKVIKESGSSSFAYVIVDGDYTTGKFTVKSATDSAASEEEITLRNNIPKIILTVPYIGYILVAMHSTEGIIIIALVILFMIILFILSELWKKIPEDEESDEEPDEEYPDEGLSKRELKRKEKEEKAKAKAEAKEARKAAKNGEPEDTEDREERSSFRKAEDSADSAVGAVQAAMKQDTAGRDTETGTAGYTSDPHEDMAAAVSEIVQNKKKQPENDYTEPDVDSTQEIALKMAMSMRNAEEARTSDKADTSEKGKEEKTRTSYKDTKPEYPDISRRTSGSGSDTAAKDKKDVKPQAQEKPQASVNGYSDQPDAAAAPKTEDATATAAPKTEYTAASAAAAQTPVEPEAHAVPREVYREPEEPSFEELTQEEEAPFEDENPQTEDSFVPVERPTLDELLDQAKTAGENPKVVKDPNTGISLVDYSDII